MRGIFAALLVSLAAIFVAGCPWNEGIDAQPPPSVRMDFTRPDFYAAPFPSDDLFRADGTIDVDAFPNPDNVSIVAQAIDLVRRDARGFSQNGGVFFALTASVSSLSLPSLEDSVQPSSPVFLLGIDPASPDFSKRYPIEVAFEADGGPFGAPNLLSLVPLQGTPLRPRTKYAAVVLRDIASPPLDVPAQMAQIARGEAPPGMSPTALATYVAAMDAIGKAGVSPSRVAAVAAFTTDAPTEAARAVAAHALSLPRPKPAPWVAKEIFDGYCVYASTIDMPDYQAGPPPYDFDATGGGWTFDASGQPVVQRNEKANLVVTIPRAPMPAGGYPIAVFVRTGGGGDRPLVDRGTQAVHNGPPLVPGTGPAKYFAGAGFAGVQVDGPHGGLRNATGKDEQFLMFNIFNGVALRDNVRESAIELVLLAHVLDSIAIDASACPGAASTARFDTERIAIMGHSMGATIAPLSVALEPRFKAAILSGAGASWIENVMWKQQPIAVKPALEVFLKYPSVGRSLKNHDPVLTMFQWAEEPADPLVYTRTIIREPRAGEPARHVLMFQGIVDHYIMPRIANATTLSLGLDLGGAELDQNVAEIADEPPASRVLPFASRRAVTLPASGNEDDGVTGVVTQHLADGIEDGHEIAFQLDTPKLQYRCFLASFAAGKPPVIAPDGAADAPCPP